MKILINDDEKDIIEHATIAQMLNNLDLTPIKGIALAVNDQVIPKVEWDRYPLHSGDKVLLIQTIAGG